MVLGQARFKKLAIQKIHYFAIKILQPQKYLFLQNSHMKNHLYFC